MKRVEFRDGERDVPDHVAELMKGIETHTMTYEQALRYSERKLLADRLNAAQQSAVDAHMRRMRY